jgi:hypothetical protein
MDINNFTQQNIRLGEYPQCVDISTVPYENHESHYHSSYAVIATTYPSDLDQYKCKVLIVQCNDTKKICTITMKWEETKQAILNNKKLFPKGLKVIYDSDLDNGS